MDIDLDLDKEREDFAIKSAMVMMELEALLEKVKKVETLAQQEFTKDKKPDIIDVYKGDSYMQPPKKRIKLNNDS
jgi:hypothetical protein